VKEKENLITKEILIRNFIYQPATGVLRWRTSRGRSERLGLAGKVTSEGYREVRINSRFYMVHRVVFFWVYGFWPDQVDHRNNNKGDNSISNLRAASHSQNRQNVRLQSNNSSGIKGVGWNKQVMKWQVRITLNGKVFCLGSYEDKFSAACVAVSARNVLHGEFCNHGSEK